MSKFRRMKAEVAQLQRAKMAVDLEAIVVLIFSTFSSVFLPQLLFRYIYATQKLTEEPKLLEYIPVAAFAIGAIYGIYALVANIAMSAKIAKMKKEMAAAEMMDEGCCTDCMGSCGCDDHGACACGACDMPMMKMDKMAEEKEVEKTEKKEKLMPVGKKKSK